jgi:hypothetical protein
MEDAFYLKRRVVIHGGAGSTGAGIDLKERALKMLKGGKDDPCSTCNLRFRCVINKKQCTILKLKHPCKECLVRATCETVKCDELKLYKKEIDKCEEYYSPGNSNYSQACKKVTDSFLYDFLKGSIGVMMIFVLILLITGLK